jgi:hypothetical protein
MLEEGTSINMKNGQLEESKRSLDAGNGWPQAGRLAFLIK